MPIAHKTSIFTPKVTHEGSILRALASKIEPKDSMLRVLGSKVPPRKGLGPQGVPSSYFEGPDVPNGSPKAPNVDHLGALPEINQHLKQCQ